MDLEKLKLKVENLSIKQIQPYPLNNKRHPDHQINEIAESIKLVGFVKPILVDEKYIILAGHGAFLGGVAAGYTSIPCIVLSHLTESQKITYRIADNKLASKSIWDFDNIGADLSALIDMDIDLSLTGFDEDEVNRILKNDTILLGPPPDPITVKSHTRTPSVPSSRISAPVTVKGDSFALGSLKLTCMDSESAGDCDWLINRWQIRTGENAIHKKGLTYNDLKDARKK